MAESTYGQPRAVLPGSAVAALFIATLFAIIAGVAAGLGEWEASIAAALVVPLAVVVLHYPWAAVLAWVAVMPFLIVDDSADVSAGVWAVHRMLIGATIVLVLVYRLLGLSRSRFRLSVTDAFAIGFLVLAAGNVMLLSNNPTRMLASTFDHLVVPIGLYWLVRLNDPSDRDIRRFVAIVLMVVGVQIAIGISSWVAPDLLPSAWLGRAGERTIGSLGGPGPYTVTLVFGALLALHTAVGSRESLVRATLLVVAGAALVGVLLSLSRGSWLGAAVAVMGLMAVFPRAIIPSFAAGAVVAVALAVGPLGGQFEMVDERLGDQATAESRLITNNAALRMIAAEPALGFGYGNFERFDEAFKERIGDIPVQPGSAHHAYLALAAENGIPALILYLLPAAWLLVRTMQLWRFMPSGRYGNRHLVVVMWLALADQFIVANFMDMLHSSSWGTGLWWLSLGLIHVIVARAAANQRNQGLPFASADHDEPRS